jgi:hypothetical protein
MSNIRKNYNNIFDLKLNKSNYWDLQLSMDNVQCYNCDILVSGDVITSFDFTNISGMCSNIQWEDAVSFNADLCDIGLTGVDNRFVDNFTGETYNPSGSTAFCIKRVSGDTFCYEMNHVLATSTIPEHVHFCGGFFQGFYKLHEYDFEVLPNYYPIGWTKEFWLKRDECPSGFTVTITGESVYYEPNGTGQTEVTEIWSLDVLSGDTCPTKPQLNEVYPENDNIFYYWGLRAENKFCLFSPLSGMTTCTGIPLSPELEVNDFQPSINPFLYYNRKMLCQPQPNPTATIDDCCNGLLNNAMAFRIDDEGAIGVRILTTSGECMTMTDGTIQYSGTPIIEEFYSAQDIIENGKWHYIVYRFEPYVKSDCIIKGRLGTLCIFVDGFLKLKIDDFPDFQPYPLDEHRDKQLAVPYNISIGGGTQGLLEVIPSGDALYFDASGYTVCDYVTSLVSPCQFGGIVVDGETFISPPLSVAEPELIQMWLEMHIPRRLGKINVFGSQFNNRTTLKIEINGSLSVINNLLYSNGGSLGVCKIRCYEVLPHQGKCGTLEENFAGSFIGGIAAFRLHDRPLCFSEIQCNWNIEKQKYNRHRDTFVCKP